jgi:carboxyl-terminal processing protease
MKRLSMLTLAVTLLLPACSHKLVSPFPDNFVGVGVELTVADEAPVVVRTIDGGPAASAGMLPRDRILAINDIPVTGMGLADVVVRLRGEEGSTVELTLGRGEQTIHARLVRRGLHKSGDDYATRLTQAGAPRTDVVSR